MRKTLIASCAACLLSTSLVGCGDKSTDAQYAEKLEALLEQMDQLDHAYLPVKGNTLTYTYGTTVQGVKLPGDGGFDAAYVDQFVALLPQAQDIASNGSAKQKESANSILASIFTSEGSYLLGSSELAFQKGNSDLVGLREQIAMLEDIIELDKAIAGDRAAIIDTIKTGKVTNGRSVEGIDQLTAKASADTQARDAALSELKKLSDKIDALNDKVAEYEALDLQLTNEARSSQAAAKFEKLDKATTAGYEAETAQAEAESLGIDVEIQQSTADLADNRKQRSETVIEQLSEKIAQVEAERRTVADKLAELQQSRTKAIEKITETFKSADAYIQAGGFDRMAKALELLKQAETAVAKAGLGSSAPIQQMSVYTLQARALQQQALSARAYASLLTSIAASGEVVLGDELHGMLSKRAAEMQTILEATTTGVTELDQTAGTTVAAVESGIDPDTPEGAEATRQITLYRSLLSSTR